MKRVLVVGANLVNKGAEAMLFTVRDELRDALGEVAVVLEPSEYNDEGRKRINELPAFEFATYGASQLPSRVTELGRSIALRRKSIMESVNQNAAHLRAGQLARNCDAALDISGFRYTESWGIGDTQKVAPLVEAFAKHEKPYIFMPQAWGPFTPGSVHSRLTKTMLGDAVLFYSRDEHSRKYLSEILSRPAEEIPRASDIAFLFRGADQSLVDAVLASHGVSNARPLVAVSPNMRVYERSPGIGRSNEYVKRLTHIVRTLRLAGATVLIMPHEARSAKEKKADDRLLCDLVSAACGDADGIFAFTECPDSAIIKGILGRCELVVGSRFHALVAALSQEVPVVSLGWSHKYEELLGEFSLRDQVLSLELAAEELSSHVEKAWQERAQLKQRVGKALPMVKESSRSVFAKVVSLLKASKS